MKRTFLFVLAIGVLTTAAVAQTPMFREGTVTRMRMSDCVPAPHRLFAALSGVPPLASEEQCPEYTLVSDSVVYVIVGRKSNHLIPLAERIRFRLQKNELKVRVDDENRESSYLVREMILRADWDQERMIEREPQTSAQPHTGRTLPQPKTTLAAQ